jgi:hypothetical protein
MAPEPSIPVFDIAGPTSNSAATKNAQNRITGNFLSALLPR